ncbi:MAG: preprotein translocase subunit SecE [Chitinophagales bacterium]
MNSLKSYLLTSYEELTTKVTWPTWKDLQSNTVIVAVASIVIALLIGVMDVISKLIFSDIIYNLTK